MTPEDVKLFAEACGLAKLRPLPDFLHSRDAVMEALEMWCGKKGKAIQYSITKYGKCSWHPQPYRVELRDDSHGVGRTLNEAIIAAVLLAEKPKKPWKFYSGFCDYPNR